MARNYSLALGSHDLNGKMKAIVLTNEDPKHLGRVGVYIPRVMSLIPNESEAKQETESFGSLSSEHTKDSKINGSSTISTVNYIWARPFMYGYSLKGQYGGEWKIPPVGARIIVEFIDANPQELYYMPFAPYDDDFGYEFSPYESESGNVNIEVLLKSLKKNIILFDSTEDKDLFIIKMNSGMEFIMDAKNNTINMHNNDNTSNIEINNNIININTKEGDINLTVEKGNINNTIKEGDINISSEKGNITCNTKEGNISGITESGKVNVESSGNITLKSSTGKIHLSAIGSTLWIPNCMPICPITQTPHGGVSGGVTNLDGNEDV